MSGTRSCPEAKRLRPFEARARQGTPAQGCPPIDWVQLFLKVYWKVTMVDALPAVNVATPSVTWMA